MTSSRTRKGTLAAAVTIGALTLAAGGGDDGGDGNTQENAQESGTSKIAYAGEIPYSYENEEGELTGAGMAIDEAAPRNATGPHRSGALHRDQ